MSTDNATKTYSETDYNAAVERARNFEAKLTDLEKKMSQYKDIDPEAHKAIREELNILKAEKATKSQDPKAIEEEVKRREADVRKGVQTELDALLSEVKGLRSKNKELEVVDKVFQAATSVFVDQAHEDVRDAIRRWCDKDEQGNIIVKDNDGKPRYSKGSTTKVMGPSEFVEWLADEKPHWAKARSKSGFQEKGTQSSTHSNGITPQKFLEMSPAQRAQLKADDPKLFLELAPQALQIKQ
jgi:hypothetical protein